MDFIKFAAKSVVEFPEDKRKVNHWFKELEAAMDGVALNAENKRAVLTMKLGGKRLIRITNEAKRRGEFPDENERDYVWLKKQTIKTFGEEKTLRIIMKEIVSRKLLRDESVEDYRADIESLVDVLWETIFSDDFDTAEQKKKLINDVVIGGLPNDFRYEVKNCLPQEEDRTIEKIEKIALNCREMTPKKKSTPFRTKEKRLEDRSPTQRREQRSPKRMGEEKTTQGNEKRCFYCKEKGHLRWECPKLQGGRKSERLEEKETHQAEANKADEHLVELNATFSENNFTVPLQYLDVTINGHLAECLVDSGSNVNIITRDLAEKFGCDVDKDETYVINKFEAKKKSSGVTVAKVSPAIDGEDEFTFLVVERNRPSIIFGRPALRMWKAIQDHGREEIRVANKWYMPRFKSRVEEPEIHSTNVDTSLESEKRKILEEVVDEYKDIFTSKDKFTDEGPVDFRINLQGNERCIEPRRRRSEWRDKIINQQVREDVEKGIIEPCAESNYVSEPVLVEKADGSWRFCVDYRKINDRTVQDHYPTPIIDDIIDMLQGKKIFSKVDAERGYHQLRIREEDRPKTAFRTSMGLFQYKRMPMGIRNASAAFQRKMEKILEGLVGNCCYVYQDDIIIFSKEVEEHAEHLRQVFERICQHGFTLKMKKCQFGFQEILFLGHWVRDGEILPNPEKVEAMLNLKLPENASQVRRFIGSVGYYRRFIKDFAKIAIPLFELTKDGKLFKMNPEAESAFLELRQAMVEAPILKMPDFHKPFLIRTDASDEAIGGVLLQKHEQIWHPVAYHSRKLQKNQINWATWEKEAYSLVDCLEKWRFYVEGRKFYVETDNVVVTALMKMKNPQKRVARWITYLQEFNFEIKHIPGRSNEVADLLSRDIEVNSGEVVDIALEQRRDPDLLAIIKYLETKELPENNNKAREVVHKADIYVIDQDILYFIGLKKNQGSNRHRKRIAIPRDLKRTVLEDCHDLPTSGHLDFQRTLARVEETYHWDGLYGDVKQYCDSCQDCYRKKNSRLGKQGQLESIVITEPWKVIGIDFIGPLKATKRLNRNIVVIRDYGTGWMETKATRDTTAETTAEFLLETFNRYGLPERIISDNAKNFTSKVTELVCQSMGVKHITITPYNAAANGLVERTNDTIIQMLRFYVKRDLSDWDVFLPYITYAYNSATSPVTKVAPYFLFFGRDPRSPRRVQVSEEQKKLLTNYNREMLLRVEEGRRIMEETKEELKQKAERYFAEKFRNVEYMPGNYVFLRKHKIESDASMEKFEDKYEGPYLIMERSGINNYVVKKDGTRVVAHVKDLKKFRGELIKDPEETDEGSWKEIEPDLTVDPTTLLGKHVLVWWPQFKNWYHGVVVGQKGKRHLVKYFDRSTSTPDDEEEIYEEKLIGYKNPYKWKLLERIEQRDLLQIEEGNMLTGSSQELWN